VRRIGGEPDVVGGRRQGFPRSRVLSFLGIQPAGSKLRMGFVAL
jgi:hypothetical protein